MKANMFNNNSSLEDHINLIKHEYDNLPPFPENQYKGRGIVICAGGLNYLANAYVCIKFMRRVTSLKIELFYAGETEVPEKVKILFEKDFSDIDLIDITKSKFRDKFSFLEIKDFKGFQIKPYAILYSSFKEIMFIDADNVILENPELLFSSKEYQQTGAVFWPDLKNSKKHNPSII